MKTGNIWNYIVCIVNFIGTIISPFHLRSRSVSDPFWFRSLKWESEELMKQPKRELLLLLLSIGFDIKRMLIKINYSSLLVKSTFFLLTLHRLCGKHSQGGAYLYAVFLAT